MSTQGRPRRDTLAVVNAAAQLSEHEPTDIGYQARLFAQTALPYRDPGDVPQWQRRNGGLTLSVRPGMPSTDPTTGETIRYGYPYGAIPRLLLVWMATEAVRTRSRTLQLGDSLSDFMRQLGMISNGYHIARLRKQAERLFRAEITADLQEAQGTLRRSRFHRMNVAEDYDLWHSTAIPEQPALFPSHVELSERFYGEVTTRPVPLSMETLGMLRGSPMRLDIYAWLTYRLSYLESPTRITWDQLMLQFGSSATTKQAVRKWRIDFATHLAEVKLHYREAKALTTDVGVTLYPSPTHVRRRALPR